MEKFGTIYRKSAEDALKGNLEGSNSVFIINYKGVDATKLGELRQDLKSAGARFFVSKNSLAKRGVLDGVKNRLSEFIDGPIGFVFIEEDPVTSSKILKSFAKANGNLIIHGGILEDKILNKKDVESLATLPNRETLIAMVVMGMKSPITNLVLLLNQLVLRFVIVIKAISDKKKT